MGLIVQWVRIAGITRDSTGATLAACNVLAFRTSDNFFMGSTVSDSNGNYGIGTSSYGAHFCVADKPGAPEVAGVTTNTLTGV